jgi:hypothetical protein
LGELQATAAFQANAAAVAAAADPLNSFEGNFKLLTLKLS